MPECLTEGSKLIWIPKPSAIVLIREAVADAGICALELRRLKGRSPQTREAARRLMMLDALLDQVVRSQSTEEAWLKFLLEWQTEPGAEQLIYLVMCEEN